MNVNRFLYNVSSKKSEDKEIQNLIYELEKIKFRFQKNKATKLREKILDILTKLGWSDQIRIDIESAITITSMKGKLGLCLQTGNMSRFYADLLKLETLFKKRIIEYSIYIIPMNNTAKILGSNIANYERLVKELDLYQLTITVPICVLGIE